MESTVANGFLLLAVGMITVFLILSLVVATGSVLIRVTNGMVKETPKAQKIDGAHIAALTAVVDHITQGTGNIDSIEKY